jgi:molecular chaperone DnaJ
VQVPTLDGTKTLRVAPGTKHGTVQRLRGEGPPNLGGGSPPKRGDIHYRFLIDVPGELSSEQSEAVEALAKAMNGNPRARLFEEAGDGS